MTAPISGHIYDRIPFRVDALEARSLPSRNRELLAGVKATGYGYYPESLGLRHNVPSVYLGLYIGLSSCDSFQSLSHVLAS